MNIRAYLKRLQRHFDRQLKQSHYQEQQLMLQGRILSEMMKGKKAISSLKDVEFKVFSQFGDDGIIQWLVGNLDIEHETFIEFGVEDYHESNTRFLLMNDNWSGFVMDGSAENMKQLEQTDYYWKHELYSKSVFIDLDNINELLADCPLGPEVGLLHVDLDGNDYWIWERINTVDPAILILEYNSVFGMERDISVPYDKNFYRTDYHHSNLYFGASLKALHTLCDKRNYGFVGCNSAGNNAYFVRRDILNDVVKECTLEEGFVVSKFRESRDETGQLTYLAGADRLAEIKGMPVINTLTGEKEEL
ncbi:MAG: hypothetical protein ACNI27_17195 [Desulfovibrio sp.]